MLSFNRLSKQNKNFSRLTGVKIEEFCEIVQKTRHNKLISRTDEVEKLTGREPIENFQRSIIYNCLNFMDFFIRD